MAPNRLPLAVVTMCLSMLVRIMSTSRPELSW